MIAPHLVVAVVVFLVRVASRRAPRLVDLVGRLDQEARGVGIVGHVVDQRTGRSAGRGEAAGTRIVARPEVDPAAGVEPARLPRDQQLVGGHPVRLQRDHPVVLGVPRAPVERGGSLRAARQRARSRGNVAVGLIELGLAPVADRRDAELVGIAVGDRGVVDLALVVGAAEVQVLVVGLAPRRADADVEQRHRVPVDDELDHVLVVVRDVVRPEIVRDGRGLHVAGVVGERGIEIRALPQVLVLEPPREPFEHAVAVLDPDPVVRGAGRRLELAVDLEPGVVAHQLLARADPVGEIDPGLVLRVAEELAGRIGGDHEAGRTGDARGAVAALGTFLVPDRRRIVRLVVVTVIDPAVEPLHQVGVDRRLYRRRLLLAVERGGRHDPALGIRRERLRDQITDADGLKNSRHGLVRYRLETGGPRRGCADRAEVHVIGQLALAGAQQERRVEPQIARGRVETPLLELVVRRQR